jgi:hypothetical protein
MLDELVVPPGSHAGSGPTPNGSEAFPLASRIIALLRDRPASGGSLAKRLGARRSVVLGACRALHRAKRVQRSGNRWVLMPGARCQGTNSAGEPCGRMASEGDVYCLHHSEPVECGKGIDPANPRDRSIPPAIDALTESPWLEPHGRGWLEQLDVCELDLFVEQMTTYQRLKDEDTLTEEQASDYLVAKWLTHWLCRQGLQRLGEPRCRCEACIDCERYFVPAVNKAMRVPPVERRTGNLNEPPAVRSHTPASDASLDLLTQEPTPAATAPIVDIIFEED